MTSATTIQNPILPGFNPDPSILRVEDDYYIATSTFEWFPGVQIHHSKDLIHWELVAHPLDRLSQLNMWGNPDSGGIWAPCLSYHEGTFYLVYTDVKRHHGACKDCHNYLVTSDDILGNWSEPIYLNSSGFDPSMFHDSDGRQWIVNMIWDHRPNKNLFGGILLQEYAASEQRLVGTPFSIFEGTPLGCTEAPHLYKHENFYYLMTAEGGTGRDHAITLARSKSITGPYKVHPQNPFVTSQGYPEAALKRAGHGSWVETPNGEWYVAHLCGRPIPYRGRCILGRETAIQKMVWREDGWPELASGGNRPELEVPAPAQSHHPTITMTNIPSRDDFESETLNIHFQTLRIPLEEDTLSLTERPGYLRLKGRESLGSLFHQALIARRQQAFCYTASTYLEFEPKSFQQMAGLVCYYNTSKFIYLYVSYDRETGKHLNIMVRDGSEMESYPIPSYIPIPPGEGIALRVAVNYDRLQFSYAQSGQTWKQIESELDATILSDEVGGEHCNFTGAFVGLCCQDLSGTRLPADFDYFEYQEA